MIPTIRNLGHCDEVTCLFIQRCLSFLSFHCTSSHSIRKQYNFIHATITLLPLISLYKLVLYWSLSFKTLVTHIHNTSCVCPNVHISWLIWSSKCMRSTSPNFGQGHVLLTIFCSVQATGYVSISDAGISWPRHAEIEVNKIKSF